VYCCWPCNELRERERGRERELHAFGRTTSEARGHSSETVCCRERESEDGFSLPLPFAQQEHAAELYALHLTKSGRWPAVFGRLVGSAVG